MAATIEGNDGRWRQGEKHTREGLDNHKNIPIYLVFFSQTQTKTKKKKKTNTYRRGANDDSQASTTMSNRRWTTSDDGPSSSSFGLQTLRLPRFWSLFPSLFTNTYLFYGTENGIWRGTPDALRQASGVLHYFRRMTKHIEIKRNTF